MKLWQRALLVVFSLAALYALWRFPLGGVGVVVLGACAAWLGRGIYRSKLVANPLGENRDYSLRPALSAFAKAGGLFAVAMLWTMLAAYGVRLRYIPDTKLSVVIFIGPALLLLAVAAVYLFAGMARIFFGNKPPQGGLQ